MKKLLILLLANIYIGQIKAQNVQDSTSVNITIDKSRLSNEEYFRIFTIKSMINVIDFEKLIEAKKGFAHLVSVSVVFDKEGRIDNSIISTKFNDYFKIRKDLTAELKSFKPISEYANCIVILPILYIRMNEISINLENKFLEGFIDLFPPQFLGKKKNIILLKPEVNPFSQTK